MHLDPERLFLVRIQPDQKVPNLTGPDPQHCQELIYLDAFLSMLKKPSCFLLGFSAAIAGQSNTPIASNTTSQIPSGQELSCPREISLHVNVIFFSRVCHILYIKKIALSHNSVLLNKYWSLHNCLFYFPIFIKKIFTWTGPVRGLLGL
jgi:hypothetical protein